MESYALILISTISYILGSIPFSYFVARFYKKNLFEVGSRNIGTANVYRATGKAEAAILALVGDMGKGMLAIFLASKLSFLGYELITGQTLAAFFAVLGHNWPVFLKFKGGKGLATLAGIILFLKWQAIILILLTLGSFILLVEFVMGGGISLDGSKKEKIKKLFSIFISQVAGRMIGIFAAILLVYIFYPTLLKIIFPALIISIAKHIKRTENFLKGKRV